MRDFHTVGLDYMMCPCNNIGVLVGENVAIKFLQQKRASPTFYMWHRKAFHYCLFKMKNDVEIMTVIHYSFHLNFKT